MTKRNIILIAIILVTIVYAVFIFNQEKSPTAKNGVLDLTGWDFDKNGSVVLHGEWELFYEDFLSDTEINKKDLKGEIVKIPSLWNSYGYSNLGYATYKLDVYVDNISFNELAVRIQNQASSYILYVNHIPVLRNGIVSINRENSQPEYLPKYDYFNIYQDKLTFILHVSNFYHNKGGFTENIELGTREDIYSEFENESRSELLISSIILLIGLNLLITYCITIRDKSMLIFSYICFIIPVRNIVIGNKIILQYFEGFPWDYILKIEYISSFLIPLLFIYFCITYFSVEKYRRIQNVFLFTGIIFITVVLFTQPIIFTKLLIGLYIYVLLCLGFSVIIIINAYMEKNKNLIWFAYSMFIVVIAVINDIIGDAYGISTKVLVPYATLIAAFIQVIFFTSNLYQMINKSQKLAEENKKINIKLASLNENLEKMVKLRTLELEEMLKMDPMTKLYNHKYIIKILNKAIKNISEKKGRICLCLFDVDDFKKINDNYGHIRGDEVLNKISNVLNAYDDRVTAGRYGGEEFILIISKVDINKAFEICEGIRREIENLKFSEKKT